MDKIRWNGQNWTKSTKWTQNWKGLKNGQNWKYGQNWTKLTKLDILIDLHIVWKILKMSHLNFWILAFSPNFCPIKTDLSGNTVWPQASGFQKPSKWTILGIFNQLLSTQNVNVARFAHNVEWDFFCDFQTSKKCWVIHFGFVYFLSTNRCWKGIWDKQEFWWLWAEVDKPLTIKSEAVNSSRTDV